MKPVLRSISRSLQFLFYIVSAIVCRACNLLLDTRARQPRARAEWLQHVAARCAQILHLRIHSCGTLPEKGLLVANHLSYIDIILIAAQRPCVFISKMEVRAWPIFGCCARFSGTIFVDQKHRINVAAVAKQMRSALDHDLLVVLFPEGTSTDGASVLPFKSSLLEPALGLGCPVAAAAIGYAIDQGSVAGEICYWGDMILLPHLLNVWSKSVIHATLRCGVARPRRGNRKSLAHDLHQEVAALHAAASDTENKFSSGI